MVYETRVGRNRQNLGYLYFEKMTVNRLEIGCWKSKQSDHEEGKQWPQILAIFIVCLGPFTNGIQFVWSSPFSLVIAQDKENYDVTEEDTALFMFFQPIGMMITSCFFFKISEFLGRKKTILSLAIPQFICWMLVIFARTKWDFYVARFIAGICDAILFSSVPPYVGEICSPTVRGKWGNTTSFSIYFGEWFITVIGSYFNVQVSAYVCIGFPIAFFTLVLLMPESPYQLIKDGKLDEARKSIQWFRRKDDVEKEFLQMKADVERQISESGSWLDLVRIPSNRRATRAGLFLRMSQQFCGISTFISYAQSLFQKAGSNLSPQHSSIIFVGLIGLLNFLCGGLVERFGRKPTFFYSHLSSGVVLICMSTYFFLEQYQLVDLSHLTWFPLVGMIVFVFTMSFGLGIVPTLMLGELFSASIKTKALALQNIFFGLGVFLSVNVYHVLVANVGLYSPFLLYAVVCFFSTFLTLKWVPETKGKTLEEIQQSLKK